jgi:TonB family protein
VFERLIASGGAHPRPSLSAFTLSVIANATLAYAAVTATSAPSHLEQSATEASEQVTYLIPPPPQRVPFEEVGLNWSGGEGPGMINAPLDEASLLAVPAGGDGGRGAGRRGGKERRGQDPDSLLLAGELAGGEVYVASELDQPVSFDPTSAAPAYPPELQQAGIEGAATMRFIVDTTGSADSTTIQEVAATHPGFAASVRAALPRMHFRPAELGSRRVRQLVEQQFKFKIQAAALAPDDSTLPPPAPVDSAGAFAGASAADSTPPDSTP